MTSNQSLFSELYCPVCLEVIKDAYVTKCGHSFCYACISKTIKNIQNKNCPKCRRALNKGENDIFPNYVLNSFIKNYQKELDKQQLFKKLNERNDSTPQTSSSSSSSLAPSDNCNLLNNCFNVEATDGLKSFMISESNSLSIPDINLMLDLLSKQKQKLVSESISVQNRLLLDFLSSLLARKQEQILQLNKEVQLIFNDINDVKESLNNVNNVEFEISSVPPQPPQLKRRMLAHFNDFVQCYFSSRSKDLAASESNQADKTPQATSLNTFREHLVKFNRFNGLKTLATLDYCSNGFNNSRIVTSVQFDKDNDFVAISGITKNIKIYDYNSIISNQMVECHYPSLEVATNSKISSLAWNYYQKNILGSCDYEGIVAIWDTNCGTTTKVFDEHERRCWSIDFNEVDSRLLVSGSDDTRVKIWTLNNDHSIATLDMKSNVCCVKFHPKSSYLLAVASVDHCVHYYDLRNLKEEILRCKGHRKTVSYVKFISDDEIVSAATDSQLKLWSLKDGSCLQTYMGHTNTKNFVGLDTDGDYIACGSENNSIYVYYKGLSKALFSYPISTHQPSNDDSESAYEFVSALCWRKHSNIILAANSLGIIKVIKPVFKENKCCIFWNLDDVYQSVAIVNLGKKLKNDFNVLENYNERHESVRSAAAAGCRALNSNGVKDIEIESFGHPESAAEGSILSLWKFQEFKEKKKDIPKVKLFNGNLEDSNNWQTGRIKAEAQNFARFLAEMPANIMTPTYFVTMATELFSNSSKVSVKVYSAQHFHEMHFQGLITVSKGSNEPAKFLEINYNGDSSGSNVDTGKRIVLIGKGVTFDAGGISIKPSSAMDEMRADMGGAAVVLATLKALNEMNVKVNLTVLIPLCENLPSASAVKPGDVIKAMNGKTICIDNTDAEGRLILADALCYSSKFNPKLVCDVATLTGAMRVALGQGTASGVFSNSEDLWERLYNASTKTGDRVWRFPLWKCYQKLVTGYSGYDVNNVGKGKGGGACTAAAFLNQFVPKQVPWLHLDIASVMGPKDLTTYLSGEAVMTGRPTRTLIEFVQLSNQ